MIYSHYLVKQPENSFLHDNPSNKIASPSSMAQIALKHVFDRSEEKYLTKRVKAIVPNIDLIGELIKYGRYETDEDDPLDSALKETIGKNQGTKRTRRLYLEILASGIDLFEEDNLNRIKRDNAKLYEIIIIKAYGHVFSESGFKNSVNKEGSCEALSMLMLFHSIKTMRSILDGLVKDSQDKLSSKGADKVLIEKELRSKMDSLFADFGASKILGLDPLLKKLSEYHSSLLECETLLRGAITAESTDEEIAAAAYHIKQNHLQIVCSGYDWHSEVLIFGLNRVIYHNRGSFREIGKEVIAVEVDNKAISALEIKALSDRFRIKRPSHTLPALMAAVFKKSHNVVLEIPLKGSKGGHCTHASIKAAIYSIFASRYPFDKSSYPSANPDYKRFTRYHRKCFSHLFKKHPVL